jgi:hypothetical protein
MTTPNQKKSKKPEKSRKALFCNLLVLFIFQRFFHIMSWFGTTESEVRILSPRQIAVYSSAVVLVR